MRNSKRLAQIIRWLIEGSRGGVTRAHILLILKERPMNPNQLARELNLNYRSVTHHLELLEKHELVEKLDKGYGRPYMLSELSQENWDIIKKSICNVLGDENC